MLLKQNLRLLVDYRMVEFCRFTCGASGSTTNSCMGGTCLLPVWSTQSQTVSTSRAVCRGSRILTPHFAEAQIGTQRSGKRPYGVGLLVIGMDVSVPAHCCFDTCFVTHCCCPTDVLPTAGGPAKVIQHITKWIVRRIQSACHRWPVPGRQDIPGKDL